MPDGPFATESELVDQQPAIEVQWPPEVLAAERKIRESFGAKLIEEATALGRSHDAFLVADVHLSNYFDQFAEPRSHWLYHPGNDRYLSQALQEIARSVQTYVAAAGALIDHARRFKKKYAPTGSAHGVEYEARIVKTFSGPETIIVDYLRNYSLHHSLPLLVGRQRPATEDGWGTLILLDTSSLLEGTPSLAERQLLETWPDGIPLSEVMAMYSSRVISFYNWLARRLPPWHRTADIELQKLNNDLQEALDQAGLGDLPRLFGELQRRKRGEL